MSNVETSRRRANIQHLKAAVAARVAERRLVEAGVRDGDDTVDATAKYRDDLARVMRPTRVRVDVTRRRDVRTAPLVLVSEQRIDRDDDLSGAEMRPRRVNATVAKWRRLLPIRAWRGRNDDRPGRRACGAIRADARRRPPVGTAEEDLPLAGRTRAPGRADDAHPRRSSAHVADDADAPRRSEHRGPTRGTVAHSRRQDAPTAEAEPRRKGDLPDFVLRFADCWKKATPRKSTKWSKWARPSSPTIWVSRSSSACS
jgi:hypothetical protein